MTIEMDHAWTPPPVLAPNIYPVDWRVEDRRALNVYERAKDLTWNPTRLAWDTIDVDALVASCAAGFQDELAAQSMPLDIALPNNLPRFWGDERLLQQILANLLSNAIKFSRGGEAVELSAGIASGGGLWFEIADRGAGMSAGDVARVLQPFEQEDTSLARRYEGIGLGLPLTKAFAELHGGRMVIDSIKGEGTRVVVEFPPERCITDGGTQGRAHA